MQHLKTQKSSKEIDVTWNVDNCCETVHGRNLAPVDRQFIPFCVGFFTSLVVSRILPSTEWKCFGHKVSPKLFHVDDVHRIPVHKTCRFTGFMVSPMLKGTVHVAST